MAFLCGTFRLSSDSVLPNVSLIYYNMQLMCALMTCSPGIYIYTYLFASHKYNINHTHRVPHINQHECHN